MRLFSSLTMLFIGALVIATNLSEVDAFGVSKSNSMGEDHPEISTSETPKPPVVNRGKIKFQMPKSLMMAVAAANPVRRTRLNRVRTTEAPVNSISRDSVEKDFSLEEQKVKSTTSKVIWWTTSTPSPILGDSMELDDAVSLDTLKSNRVLPVNRFNRFRTTPAPVTRDSFEQGEGDGFVLALARAVNKPATPKNRFSRVRTTAAPQLISRDSLELNDVSLEVVQVNPAATPVLNRARTASRGLNKFPVTAGSKTMNRLNRTRTPVQATTVRNFVLADSKEVDSSLEDVALAILPTTTQTPAGSETTTTGGEVTTSSTFIISGRSDERVDLSTELDDMLTTIATQGTTAVESEEVTGTTVILSKQSGEWDDLDDIVVLQTTTSTATTTPAPTTPETAATTTEATAAETVETTPAPTTAAPVVSRAQSRGRGKFQATISAANQVSKVNRIRTTMAPKISRDSDEQKDSIIMAVLSPTTSAPVSRSRFSRVRASTLRPPASEDSQKEVPAAATTTTIRSTGNRFNRFRASTTTTAVPAITTKAVEREDAAPRRFPQKKSRFGNARPGVVRAPVSVDSGEKDTILLGDVLKVNKANDVVLVAVDSDTVSQAMEATPAAVRHPPTSRRNQMVRGRMTTARPIVLSRHSGEENVSAEDLVININPITEQMLTTPSDPAIAAPAADVSLISRHSDEQRDHASLEQVDKVIVPVPGGSLVVDVDVSDEVPATTTLDPISNESAEKDDLALVVDASAVSPVAVVVDSPDTSDEMTPVIVPIMTTVKPIPMESEEIPVVKTRTRNIVNRGRLNRKQISQI